MLVASQLSRVFVAAVEAAFPGVVVVSGPVEVATVTATVTATVAPVAPAAAAAAVVPTILATRPDGLHVAARLPGVAVAEASTARSVII